MINDSRSSSADVTSGIAQGSILRPMLFICYINDMPTSVQSSIYLFADDAKLYRNIALDDDPRTPARPSATGEMVKGMAVAIQRKQVQAHAPRSPKPTQKLHHGSHNTGDNNQREGPWSIRGHGADFREKHIETVNQANRMPGVHSRTQPSLIHLP